MFYDTNIECLYSMMIQVIGLKINKRYKN